ncbi:MAG: rod shape-determining protein RodA [Clostridia bacterium]|nr:rod shape-determining protein RodA [Clostridia bacterium]
MNILKSIVNCIRYSDKFLWSLTLFIAIYGLTLVASISREGFNYFFVQSLSILIGLIGAVILQTVDYKHISKASLWIGIFGALLIIYTLFMGVTIEGASGVNAKAWIKLPGGITFQPSELVKIAFIITFSTHMANILENDDIKDPKNIVLLLAHALVPVVLTHLQGDDGAAIIFLCIAITISFVGGVPIRYFMYAAISAIILAPIAWNFVLADYQKKRILSQLNPEGDPLNMGYQQIQGKLSIGSGGVFGVGLFKGPRIANNVVPIQESDFIFSAAGEELGFIGCVLIILLLLLAIIRIGHIAKHSQDTVGSLICFGFIGLVASQTIFNLGMCLSLMPVMGVTLPFFSVGGSSAACLYLALGIIQNIYLNADTITKRRKSNYYD